METGSSLSGFERRLDPLRDDCTPPASSTLQYLGAELLPAPTGIAMSDLIKSAQDFVEQDWPQVVRLAMRIQQIGDES
jgi:hypothetical protein